MLNNARCKLNISMDSEGIRTQNCVQWVLSFFCNQSNIFRIKGNGEEGRIKSRGAAASRGVR